MSSETKRILVATSNAGKLGEFRSLIDIAGLRIVGFDDVEPTEQVAETGSTFKDNAHLKATGYARQTHLPTLADDSGLEVSVLGNRPGIKSARYGGEALDFAGKMALILNELKTGDRRARFVSVLAFSDAAGNVLATTTGVLDGHLADGPRGTGGFGYDPIFIPDGFDLTLGELPPDIKQAISHRGQATRQIIPFLRHFYRL